MKTLEMVREVYELSDSDVKSLLLDIIDGKYYTAMCRIRFPGESLFVVAKTLRKIAKEELDWI